MPRVIAWSPSFRGKVQSLNQYVYGEEDVMAPLRSVRTARYKLIENLWTGKFQLFDVVHDPAERDDLLAKNLPCKPICCITCMSGW